MNFVTTGYIGTKYVVLIAVLMLLWASYLFLSADGNVEPVTTEPASPARDTHLLDARLTTIKSRIFNDSSFVEELSKKLLRHLKNDVQFSSLHATSKSPVDLTAAHPTPKPVSEPGEVHKCM